MADSPSRLPPSSEDAEKYGVSLAVLRFQSLIPFTGLSKHSSHPRPNLHTCTKCLARQPIFKTCTKCYTLRRFKCFPTVCFDSADWDDWEHYACRLCREDAGVVGTIADPLPGEEAVHLAWLQQEKVKLYLAKAKEYKDCDDPADTADCSRCNVKSKQKRRSCFHCGDEIQQKCSKYECWTQVHDKRMDFTWFCYNCVVRYQIALENIENYCYLCRNPMPISGNCKNCGQFYRFHCLYPPKCITTLYSKEGVGMDRWDHCPNCLNQKDLEIVDVKMCVEAEKEHVQDVTKRAEEEFEVINMDIDG